MTKVNFYDEIEDTQLKFAVIIARKDGKWVVCKHKDRETWEVPGGHSEIERISIMEELPEKWTYPEIQPKLLVEAKRRGYIVERL